MRPDRTLEELWDHGRAPLATTVRLEMDGSMRMNGVWHPFEAEQVLCWERGFVWAANVWMNGLPVTGFDRLVDEEARMRWRILGLFPVVRADGQQIARSAAGRMHAETGWDGISVRTGSRRRESSSAVPYGPSDTRCRT